MAMKRPFTDDSDVEHPGATAVLDTLNISFQDKVMCWSFVFFHTQDQAKRFSGGERVRPLKAESYDVNGSQFLEMLKADPDVYAKVVDMLEKRAIATKDRPNPDFDPKRKEDPETNPAKISYFWKSEQVDLAGK